MYCDHRDLHVLTHAFPTRRSSDLVTLSHLCREVETQIGDMHQQAEEKLNQREPGRLSQYRQLLEMNRKLHEEAKRSTHEISMLTQKIHDMDGDSRTQNNREHYATLEKQIHKLQRERESLHQALEIAKLPVDQANTRFIAKVKAENKHIGQIK